MKNQIRNIFNSTICEVSMLVIICCLIFASGSIKSSGHWTEVAVASGIIGGVVLFGLLIWITYNLVARKEVKEMSLNPRVVIEFLSHLLFLYWIYITAGLLIALVWAVFVVWDVVRSIKQLV